MRMLIAIPVYDVDEACIELAKLTDKPKKYSRQRINILVKEKIQAPLRIGKRYLLTEAQLSLLAEALQTQKRPKLLLKNNTKNGQIEPNNLLTNNNS